MNDVKSQEGTSYGKKPEETEVGLRDLEDAFIHYWYNFLAKKQN